MRVIKRVAWIFAAIVIFGIALSWFRFGDDFRDLRPYITKDETIYYYALQPPAMIASNNEMRVRVISLQNVPSNKLYECVDRAIVKRGWYKGFTPPGGMIGYPPSEYYSPQLEHIAMHNLNGSATILDAQPLSSWQVWLVRVLHPGNDPFGSRALSPARV